MKQHMKVPEQPREQFPERPQDAVPTQIEKETPRVESPREQEMINARTTVVEKTRNALGDLSRQLPKPKNTRQERFVA